MVAERHELLSLIAARRWVPQLGKGAQCWGITASTMPVIVS